MSNEVRSALAPNRRHGASDVEEAKRNAITTLPKKRMRSMTWAGKRYGATLLMHCWISRVGVPLYSTIVRANGSNKTSNRLIRQHLLKHGPLRILGRDLNEIWEGLNGRRRETLGHMMNVKNFT